MDRIEFANSLKTSENEIVENFDEFMSCYDLIAYYNMLQVDNYTPLDSNSILFNISITSDISVERIKSILDATIIDKYCKIFKIKSNIIDYNKLSVIFYKTGVSG